MEKQGICLLISMAAAAHIRLTLLGYYPTKTQHRDYPADPSDPSAPHCSSYDGHELPPPLPEINPAVHLQRKTEGPIQVPGRHRSTAPYKPTVAGHCATGPRANAWSPTGLLQSIGSSPALPSSRLAGTPASGKPSFIFFPFQALPFIISLLILLPILLLVNSFSSSPSHPPEAAGRPSGVRALPLAPKDCIQHQNPLIQ